MQMCAKHLKCCAVALGMLCTAPANTATRSCPPSLRVRGGAGPAWSLTPTQGHTKCASAASPLCAPRVAAHRRVALSARKLSSGGESARKLRSAERAHQDQGSSQVRGLVNKEVYQDALQCTRLAWHRRHRLLPAHEISDTAKYLMEQGIAFEQEYLALNHTHGAIVKSVDLQSAAAETAALMADIQAEHDLREGGGAAAEAAVAKEVGGEGKSGTAAPAHVTQLPSLSATSKLSVDKGVEGMRAIFQATFVDEGVVAKADAIEYVGGGQWDIVEVKSCSEKHVKEYLLDLSFTVYVATRAGVNVRNVYLVAVSSTYRYGMPPNRLFSRVSMTDQVFGAFGALHDLAGNGQINRSRHFVDVLTSSPTPPPTVSPFCKKCLLFQECMGKGLEHPIWELPRLTGDRFREVAHHGLEVADAPLALLTKSQLRFQQAVLAGGLLADIRGLAACLRQLVSPIYYLDFESVSPLRPAFESVAPWQTVLTQYSLHAMDAPSGAPLRHYQYLADARRDCREELAVSLLRDVGEVGSIIVYSSYEKTQLAALAELLPHLAPQLAAVVDRLVDLEKVIKEHVAHPLFRGRSSLKVTLPVLVPAYKTRYAALAVANGADAATAFERLASPDMSQEETEQLRKELLEYCELDTLAMVELHAALNALLPPATASATASAEQQPSSTSSTTSTSPPPTRSPPSAPKGVVKNNDSLKELKVVELKKMLQERGLSTAGLKADLVERLSKAAIESSGGGDSSNGGRQ